MTISDLKVGLHHLKTFYSEFSLTQMEEYLPRDKDKLNAGNIRTGKEENTIKGDSFRKDPYLYNAPEKH